MKRDMKKILLTLVTIITGFGIGTLNAQQVSTVWTKKMGSTGNESILAVKTDANGNQYVSGYFTGTVDFDPNAGVTNLVSAGSYDIFICKYDPDGALVWAKRIGGATGNDVAWGLALDASNNVHVTGYFNGAVDFDPGAGTSNMSSAGLDIFVLKLDENGNFIWSRKMGGGDLDQAYDIAVDGSGNVYTTGYFTNSADFDPGAGSTILTVGSLSVEAAFLSVLNSSGNFVAAKQITGTDALTRGLRVRVDASNNVYLCGYFGGTVDFDPNAGTVNMTSTGSENAYVMKLNSSFNYVWAKRTGGTAETRANGMDLDGSGNVIVTGQYIGTVDFDPGAGTTNLTSVNSNDIYVQKLDASGNFSWARSMGGTMDNYGLTVKVDQNNEIYVAGQFSGTVDFDPGAGTNNLSATGSFDLFVTKLNTGGNFILARKIGGGGVDYLNNITTLGTSQIFIGGYFEGTVDFDINAGVSNLSSSGARDIFLTKWDFCTIPPSNPGSISGSSSVCAGSSSTYSVTAVAGAATYNWTLPAGWSGVSTNSFITATAGSSGTITLSASNGCGTTGIVSFPITVLTIPSTPGTISGNANVCMGSSSTYSVSSVPGATSYVWALPVGWTGASTTSYINGTVNSSGTITVAASNTCGTSGTSSLPVTILTAPSAPGSISGNTTVCSGTSENYTITDVVGATSYIWTMPAGWSGSSSTTAISSIAGSSGTITVSASNSCGTSGTASLPITVNTIPSSPAMINGNNSICEGESTVYDLASISGATSYSWTLPSGWIGSSSTEMITATGTQSGAISVTANNTCGSSSPASINVTVHTIPTVFGNGVTICEGSVAELEASTDFGTIQWFDEISGGTALLSGPIFITGVLYNDTTFYLEADNNGCINDPRLAVNVTVNPMPNVGLNPGGGAIASLQNNATSYQWIDCNNSNEEILNETAQMFVPTQNGSYAVVVNLNGCIDTSACEVISNVGLDELTSYSTSLYPNPAHSDIQLSNQQGIGQVSIYSAEGKLILVTYGNDQSSLKLRLEIQPGMYYMHVQSAKSGIVESIAFVIN
jgi:hypothetical protein